MIKSKIKYFGSAGLMLVLVVWLIGYAITIMVTFESLQINEKLFLIYGGPFVIVGIILFGSIVLSDINHIEIHDGKILIKNVILRKEKVFHTKSLLGFKHSSHAGFRVSFVDNDKKMAFKVYEMYYSNFDELVAATNLQHLGKEPSVFKRLIGKEKF